MVNHIMFWTYINKQIPLLIGSLIRISLDDPKSIFWFVHKLIGRFWVRMFPQQSYL